MDGRQLDERRSVNSVHSMSKMTRRQAQTQSSKRTQRAENVAATRAKILQAARRIILRQGLGALSIRKLATQVRYAPGTIYLYFKNREAIARELCLHGYRELLACLQAAGGPGDSPATRLRALFTAYLNFGLANPETYRLIFVDEPAYLAAVFADRPADDPATQAYQLLVDAARALPTPGKARSRASAVELAEACWAAVHGVVSLKLTCPSFPTTPPETLCRRLLDGLTKER